MMVCRWPSSPTSERALRTTCVSADSETTVPGHSRALPELVVVPDAGHFLHLERPDVVGATVTAFVAG